MPPKEVMMQRETVSAPCRRPSDCLIFRFLYYSDSHVIIKTVTHTAGAMPPREVKMQREAVGATSDQYLDLVIPQPSRKRCIYIYTYTYIHVNMYIHIYI